MDWELKEDEEDFNWSLYSNDEELQVMDINCMGDDFVWDGEML